MTVTTVEDRDRAPSGEAGRARAWAAVCIAAASAFLYVADSAFVSLAIPQIEATFPSVPRARIGWVATAFMVTQASLLLIAGRLGDRRGRRRYFVLGLAAYGVGAAIAAVAPGLWWLLGARVVQGAGAALFAAGALALVLPLFPSARAAHVVGVWGLVGSVAGWLTPVLGSWLVGINWRWEFAVLAPFGLVVAVLGLVANLVACALLRPGAAESLNLRGAYLVSGGDIDRAMMWYARGYYYEAKRRGLLEETGLASSG